MNKDKLKDSFKEICEAQGDAIRGEYEEDKDASEDAQEDTWDGLEEIYAEDEALGEIFEANGVYAYEEIYDEFTRRYQLQFRQRGRVQQRQE